MKTVKDYNLTIRAFLFIYFALTLTIAYAQNPQLQTYTVRGEVHSLVDGLPLVNIRVFLKGTDYGAVSNAKGVYEIKGVPAGTYDVIAKYPDFDATILKGISVPPRERKSYIFDLEPADGMKPLPYIDKPAPDSLGYLEGEIKIRIDAYNASFEKGHLLLRAAVSGDLREGYLYPQKWKILPKEDQAFRFKFYLPKGKSYRLYLIWQEEREAYFYDRIIDVVRMPDKPKSAAVYDLGKYASVPAIRYEIDLLKSLDF